MPYVFYLPFSALITTLVPSHHEEDCDMEGLWAIVLVGPVLPAGIMGLVLLLARVPSGDGWNKQ